MDLNWSSDYELFLISIRSVGVFVSERVKIRFPLSTLFRLVKTNFASAWIEYLSSSQWCFNSQRFCSGHHNSYSANFELALKFNFTLCSISRFLDRFLKEHIGMKDSLESKLQFESISSVTKFSKILDILKKLVLPWMEARGHYVASRQYHESNRQHEYHPSHVSYTSMDYCVALDCPLFSTGFFKNSNFFKFSEKKQILIFFDYARWPWILSFQEPSASLFWPPIFICFIFRSFLKIVYG